MRAEFEYLLVPLHKRHLFLYVQFLAQQQFSLLLRILTRVESGHVGREIPNFAVVLAPLDHEVLRCGRLGLPRHSLLKFVRHEVVLEDLQVAKVVNFEHEFLHDGVIIRKVEPTNRPLGIAGEEGDRVLF